MLRIKIANPLTLKAAGLSTYYLLLPSGVKGYLRYKTIFCHKVALDAQLMIFFIRNKNEKNDKRFSNQLFIIFLNRHLSQALFQIYSNDRTARFLLS